MFKNKKISISVLILIVTIISLASFIGFKKPNQAHASALSAPTDQFLFGTAWSPNLGQISFNNCSDPSGSSCGTIPYQVKVISGGVLSGYAWSDHAGWIKFDSSITGPGGSSATAQYATNGSGDITGITGFARAVDGTNKPTSASVWNGWNGWDGYISFGSPATTNYGVSAAASYISNGFKVQDLSGSAWGSAVVGQIDMSGVTVASFATPACNITAGTPSISSGQSSTLSWVSTGVTSCTASASPISASWTGSQTVPTGTGTTGTLTTTGVHTFSLNCTGPAGPATCSAPVAVNTSLPPTVTLTANPASISSLMNGSSTLTWTSTNATSCTATTNGTWSGSKTPVASGSQTVTGITPPKTYTITCTGPGGSNSASATVSLKSIIHIIVNFPIDGSCSTTTPYTCVTGQNDISTDYQSSTQWTWTCDGTDGGTPTSCSLPFSSSNCTQPQLNDPTNKLCYCSSFAPVSNLTTPTCMKVPSYIDN